MSFAGNDMTMVIRARNLAKPALQSVSGDLARVNAQTGAVRGGFGTMAAVGTKAVGGLGLAVVGFSALGISAYSKFEGAMTQSLAIMGDVSEDAKGRMETAARDVAKTTTFSATEAAEAYFFLASAGLDASASIEAMPQVALFAQAGMFDLARATDLATDAQSALGMTVAGDPTKNLENMTRVTDVLVKANTLANASVEQFSEALVNKAGAALKVANKDIEEGAAVLAVYADQGFKGQIAGEMFSRVLKGLQINAIANKDVFDELGVSVFDAEGNMNNMADIVGDLTGAFEGLSDEQKTQQLLDMGFSARQQDLIKILLGSEDAMRDYETALRDAGGMTQEVADKQLTSINAKWKLFTSRITDVFISIGKKLGPVLGKLLDWLADLAEKYGPKVIDFFGDLFGAINKWVIKPFGTFIKYIKNVVSSGDTLNDFLADLPGPLKTIAKAVGSVVNFFKNLSPEWKKAIGIGLKVAAVVGAITIAVGILTSILGALFSPVILIIAAIAALAAGVYWAWNRFEGFRNVVGAVIDWFKGPAVKFLKDAWEKIRAAVADTIDVIMTVIRGFIDTAKAIWKRFGTAIKNVAKRVWDTIKTVIETVIEVIRGIIEVVTGIIKGDWKKVWNGIKRIARNLWEGIKTVIGNAIGLVRDGILGVLRFIRDEIWKPIWNGIKRFVFNLWESIKRIVRKAANLVKKYVIDPIKRLWDWWKKTWNKIKTKVVEIWNALVGWIGGVVDDFLGPIIAAFETVWGWMEKLSGFLGLGGQASALITGGASNALGTIIGQANEAGLTTEPLTLGALRSGPTGDTTNINVKVEAPPDLQGMARTVADQIAWERKTSGL